MELQNTTVAMAMATCVIVSGIVIVGVLQSLIGCASLCAVEGWWCRCSNGIMCVASVWRAHGHACVLLPVGPSCRGFVVQAVFADYIQMG